MRSSYSLLCFVAVLACLSLLSTKLSVGAQVIVNWIFKFYNYIYIYKIIYKNKKNYNFNVFECRQRIGLPVLLLVPVVEPPFVQTMETRTKTCVNLTVPKPEIIVSLVNTN